MIVTELYQGQGLGNQLFCYVTTRCLALRNGYDFGIMGREKFKAKDFMSLDFGCFVSGGLTPIEGKKPVKLPKGIDNYYVEEERIHPIYKCDVREVDHQLLNVADSTKIDGCMQAEEYFHDYKKDIRTWLQVANESSCFEYSNDDTCIINFRGGEYLKIKDAFLRPKYWKDAVENIKCRFGAKIRFVVVTDDIKNAKLFFPQFEVIHRDIATDYSIIHNAKYAIISNSTFAFWPIWTSLKNEFVIAPMYWGRHNISDGFWSLGYNCYSGWHYQDRDGDLYTYEDCQKALQKQRP
jgi:hypothetical protein